MSAAESKAVFLSYASQDAEAAKRICEALRAAGIEVWFDQSELVGGDAWDAKIRGQIASCALFVPVISAATQARREGYFRLEWKLAAQRTHMMSERTAFLLPVVIDATGDKEADVPSEFRAVQWTRLSADETSAAFCARVNALLEGDVGAGAPRPSNQEMRARTPVLSGKSSRWLALVIGILAAAMLVLWRPWRMLQRPAAPGTSVSAAPSSPAAAPINDKSIAVLPFSNKSDDKEASAFFSDGVHEDILTNLANIREFRVVPRASVEPCRDTRKNIPQIAQDLRVTYLLTGSVRRAGNEVRVTGMLINARTEENVWADSYTRSLTNVFSIQTEIATAIARALETALSPEEKNLVARRPTTSAAAYEQFLKAREVRRGFDNAFRNGAAMEPFLLEAVRLDPNYAAAYAELVYVYTIDSTAAARRAQLAKARDAVDQARRLAPDSPEVILALGDYYLGSGDAARALEQFERFGRLRPKDPDYLARLAETYQRQGKGMEEKTWETRKLLEDVDPGNLANLYRTVNLLVTGRRYAEALAVQRRIWTRLPDNLEARHFIGFVTFLLNGSTRLQDQFWSEIKPDAWDRGEVWWRRWVRMQGRLDEAVRFDLTHPLAGDPERINMAIIHAARGDLAAARARLGDLPERLRSRTAPGGPGANNAGPWIQLGTIEGVLGNRAEALRCTQRAIALSPEPRTPSNDLARLCAWAGDKDTALAELGEHLASTGGSLWTGNVFGLKRDPNFFPLQGDPRFEALLKDPKNHAPLF